MAKREKDHWALKCRHCGLLASTLKTPGAPYDRRDLKLYGLSARNRAELERAARQHNANARAACHAAVEWMADPAEPVCAG